MSLPPCNSSSSQPSLPAVPDLAPTGVAESVPRLNSDQLLVLQLPARGYSTEQIAAMTATTEQGIEDVVATSVRWLDTPDRAEALVVCRQRDLII